MHSGRRAGSSHGRAVCRPLGAGEHLMAHPSHTPTRNATPTLTSDERQLRIRSGLGPQPPTGVWCRPRAGHSASEHVQRPLGRLVCCGHAGPNLRGVCQRRLAHACDGVLDTARDNRQARQYAEPIGVRAAFVSRPVAAVVVDAHRLPHGPKASILMPWQGGLPSAPSRGDNGLPSSVRRPGASVPGGAVRDHRR